ncbi:MAG: hypothetical protein GY717_04945 [Rhodobacteraceae bacterium]|nr:hypothetical protein [Paracoccaceae bacterium]
MRGSRLISGFAAGLALLASSVHAMTEIPGCTVETDAGVLRIDAVDLGGGMTSYLENVPDKGTTLVISSCHTGDFIRAPLWIGPEARRTEYPAVMEEFDGVTGDNAVVSIRQLAELFEARDVPASYGNDRRETCACAAAYPGLRGTKEGYLKQ